MEDIYPLADPIVDQLSPTVNMLQISRCPKASLHTILEGTLSSESQGSMEMVSETPSDFPPFPLGFGGRIFHVIANEPSRDGENDEERQQRLNRNINREQRRANEATIVLAEAAHNGEQLDSQGRPCPLCYNLDDEFVHVDGHDVYKTPSVNLVVAANELARLEQTPKVAKVTTMLKAAHC